MKIFFERIYLHLKNIKALFFFTLIIVHLFLPFIGFLSYKSENLDFYMSVMEYALIVIPLSSTIWSLFILREYVEGKGNELLFIGKNKIKFLECFIPFILFYVTIIFQFLIYIRLDNTFKFELIRLFFICFFFFSLMYFLVFLTKSVSLTLMVLIAYTILNVLIDGHDSIIGFLFYFNVSPYSKTLFINQSIPMLIFSSIFIAAALVINKKSIKFN